MNLSDYGIYRVSAVTPELRITDCKFNTQIISEIIADKRNSSDLFVFPELSITGYSCQDLFFQNQLLDNAELAILELCEISKNSKCTLIIGAPLKNQNRLYNCAIIINNGIIKGVVPKTHLCNYNEYYENRWFSSEFDRDSDFITIAGYDVPFGADLIFENKFDSNFRLGIEICEDLWAVIPPSSELALAGCTIIANLSASNEYLGKSEYRENHIRMYSGSLFSAYIYSSAGLWESSSDTVFSGKSMICENSKILASTLPFSFESQICTSDIDLEMLVSERLKNKTFAREKYKKSFRTVFIEVEKRNYEFLNRKISQTPFVPNALEIRNKVCSEIIELQSAALSRRLLHIGCKNILIGISGGLDSTLALLVSINAFKKINLDKKGIIAVTMPGFGTTDRTKNNATKLIEELGVTLKTIPISKSIKQHFTDIEQSENDHNIVYENAQARERTQILMDLANKYNGIVIGTGDLSESALGWCTFAGDHISMYGINSGVPKTLVKYLIEWFSNDVFSGIISVILKDIINTPISPELLPPNHDNSINQETELFIGPYLLNDFFLYYFIRYGFNKRKIMFLAEITFKDTYSSEMIENQFNYFTKRFFENQFKRNAIPDGPKIGTVSLSPRTDWRMAADSKNFYNSQ